MPEGESRIREVARNEASPSDRGSILAPGLSVCERTWADV